MRDRSFREGRCAEGSAAAIISPVVPNRLMASAKPTAPGRPHRSILMFQFFFPSMLSSPQPLEDIRVFSPRSMAQALPARERHGFELSSTLSRSVVDGRLACGGCGPVGWWGRARSRKLLQERNICCFLICITQRPLASHIFICFTRCKRALIYDLR